MSTDGPSADSDATFDGYRRSDDRVGVRDRVLVLPSVICSHLVAEEIAARSPNAVATPHDHGCAQLGADNDQTERTLVNVGKNPNVAGTLVVGLGCEEVQSDTVAMALDDEGYPVREIAIQDLGGTDECIDAGVSAVDELRMEAATATPTTLDELTVGIVVGDVDESTVRHANPLLAALVERVTTVGGRVLVAGNERFAAHPEATRERASAPASAGVESFLDRHDGVPARATRVHADSIAKGPEAATGFIGDHAIDEAVEYGARASASGVSLVDAPSRFEEAATGLAAAGAQLVIHVTADGVPAGHPVVPVLKVSGDAGTLRALPDDVDVDARTADPTDLVAAVRNVADGAATCAEGHGLTEFAITRVGPSM
ncbi:UxaA family hydrolase (plasmid) [Halarchaeum sp. CBA1220]|uniref:UxaA family hydrolase n=1 Tax=Halarchaeum sp. CBA1220 TaxID=1853682 RepID=UPI000F3A86AF|nr:UxaA family hydrolase [Halarchaeum sp. CBA1220]QLC35258.1 UxaA family hydrolase [Halarchaeum sp. CBA1220]